MKKAILTHDLALPEPAETPKKKRSIFISTNAPSSGKPGPLSLHDLELPSAEEEAAAIVEAVKKQRKTKEGKR